jgi:hypothetical protein
MIHEDSIADLGAVNTRDSKLAWSGASLSAWAALSGQRLIQLQLVSWVYRPCHCIAEIIFDIAWRRNVCVASVVLFDNQDALVILAERNDETIDGCSQTHQGIWHSLKLNVCISTSLALGSHQEILSDHPHNNRSSLCVTMTQNANHFHLLGITCLICLVQGTTLELTLLMHPNIRAASKWQSSTSSAQHWLSLILHYLYWYDKWRQCVSYCLHLMQHTSTTLERSILFIHQNAGRLV